MTVGNRAVMVCGVIPVLVLATVTLAQVTQEIGLSQNTYQVVELSAQAPQHVFTLPIGASRLLTLDVTSSNSRVDVEILTPSGAALSTALVDRFTVGPGDVPPLGSVLFEQGFHVQTQITSPSTGNWTVRVNLPAGSAPTFVKLSSFVTGGLSIGVTTSRPAYQASDTAVLTLLAFRDGTPVTGATATARVSLAGSPSTPTEVALFDDGREPDAEAGDGVYTGGVSDLAPGHYLVTASARAGDYLATGGTNFDVTESLARLTGTKTDAGVDTNGDGLFEWIRVDIGVAVEMAATYEVLASLGTPSGTNELTAASEAALGPGEQSVELRFLATDIRRALGTAGPWEVREVELVPVSPNGVSRTASVDRLSTLGLTRAYSLAQLQRPLTQVLEGLTERAVDTNANGLFDLLQTTFQVDTLRAGSYTWTGSLRTLDGMSVGVSSGQGILPAGVTTVGFAFNGKVIGASGLDGPYRLADVAVYGPAGAAGLQTEVGDTRRYLASQFEGSRITFDRLLELVDALPIFGRGGVPFTQGILDGLRQKVSNAKDQAVSGQNQSAIGMLGAFINELEALPLERVMPADTQRLIDFARRLQGTLR